MEAKPAWPRDVGSIYRHHAYSLDKWTAYARFLSDRINDLSSSKPLDALRIIAKRSDGVFLVAIDNEYGFLLSDDGKAISLVMVHDSFLSRVHYEEMHDRTGFDLIGLYKNAIRMTRDDIIIDDMMFSYNK